MKTLNEYQDWVVGFDQTPQSPTVHALGLAGEAGEAVDLVKKRCYSMRGFRYYDAYGPTGADVKNRMCEELGDTLYYIAALAADYGLTLEEIADGNKTKLRDRHGSRL